MTTSADSVVSQRSDTLVVGAPYDDDDGGESGSAYVYRFDGSAWNFETKLTRKRRGYSPDYFGKSVVSQRRHARRGSTRWLRDILQRSTGCAYVYRFDGNCLEF